MRKHLQTAPCGDFTHAHEVFLMYPVHMLMRDVVGGNKDAWEKVAKIVSGERVIALAVTTRVRRCSNIGLANLAVPGF